MQFSLMFIVVPIIIALIQVLIVDSSKLEGVAKEANRLFSKTRSKTQFEDSFNGLVDRVNQLTLGDVFLKKEFIEDQNLLREKNHPNSLHIPVFEDAYMSIVVFILKSGTALPLHDHPLMYGIIKVLYGSADIQSYSHLGDFIKESRYETCLPSEQYYFEENVLYPGAQLEMYRNPPVILNATSGCGIVTPINNIHKVQARDGPVVFLDVLAPPYDTIMNDDEDTRKCTYFEEIMCTNEPETVILKKSKPPKDLVMKQIPFKGRELSVDF